LLKLVPSIALICTLNAIQVILDKSSQMHTCQCVFLRINPLTLVQLAPAQENHILYYASREMDTDR